MRWIRDHKLFSIVAAIIVALLISVVISYLSGGGATFVGSSIGKALTDVQKPFVAMYEGIESTLNGVFNHSKIEKENKKLKAENEKLKKKNIELTLKKAEYKELKDLSKAFSFEPYVNRSNAVAAEVISMDKSISFNVFTINKGREKGIKAGHVVVDGYGLVGSVEKVGKGWAKVRTIVDSEHKVSFLVKRKPSVVGVVHSSYKGDIGGYILNEKAQIIEGDTLITLGLGKYPKGLVIGKVTKVNFNSDTQLKEIKVKSASNFRGLKRVAVFR